MAHSAGNASWALPKQKLTKKVIAEKGKMVAEQYQEALVAISSAALELGSKGDALGLNMLTKAVEVALACGVQVCAAHLGVELDEQ